MIIIFYFRSHGFKEFGLTENLTNPKLPLNGNNSGGSSNVSPSSISPVSSKYLNPATTTQQSLQQSAESDALHFPPQMLKGVSDADVEDKLLVENNLDDGEHLSDVIESGLDHMDDEVCVY